MKNIIFTVVLLASSMIASALDPGKYLISTVGAIGVSTKQLTPVGVYRGYILTIPKQGAPKLEVATLDMNDGDKIDKIESVKITDGRDKGDFTLEAKFIVTEEGGIPETCLLVLSYNAGSREAAGSEINVAKCYTQLLMARIGRLSTAEQAGADQPATKPADKVPAKDQSSIPTSKDGPR